MTICVTYVTCFLSKTNDITAVSVKIMISVTTALRIEVENTNMLIMMS